LASKAKKSPNLLLRELSLGNRDRYFGLNWVKKHLKEEKRGAGRGRIGMLQSVYLVWEVETNEPLTKRHGELNPVGEGNLVKRPLNKVVYFGKGEGRLLRGEGKS